MTNATAILIRILLLAAIGFALALGAQAWRSLRTLEAPSDPEANAPARTLAPLTLPPNLPTGVFKPSAVVPVVSDGHPLATRFRLAGTFFLFGPASADASSRRAILDDMQKNAQSLVGEGDMIDGIQVARVMEDHVVLKSGNEEVELWLSFRSGAGDGTTRAGGASQDPEEVALETTAFGRRIADNRWVIRRQALMDYYQALLDDPERIAGLYMSMKPAYDADNAIRGYRVAPEAEQDFFKSVGLQEGDVIRKVNSMNMTSQRRAEYFMGEFIRDRVNAFVLDIERGGQEQKLIYLVR